MKVIIAGGRDFTNYEILKRCCEDALSEVLTETIIISGCAKGADALGERFAKEKHLECLAFPADWVQHKKAAGYIRNKQMAKEADACICFYDGKSKGTGHMIQLARAEGIQLIVYDYEGNYKENY